MRNWNKRWGDRVCLHFLRGIARKERIIVDYLRSMNKLFFLNNWRYIFDSFCILLHVLYCVKINSMLCDISCWKNGWFITDFGLVWNKNTDVNSFRVFLLYYKGITNKSIIKRALSFLPLVTNINYFEIMIYQEIKNLSINC